MFATIPYRAMARSAGQTVLCLFGGLLVSAALGALVASLNGRTITDPSPLHGVQAALTYLAVLLGLVGGSASWGVQMGRLAQVADGRRMAIAGALGFGPIVVVCANLLGALEPVVVRQFGSQLPIHRIFTLMFVPTVFISAAVSAGAIGVGLRNTALARSLSWRVGLAAALGFLVVNLVMETLGFVVGAPRAAERFTMLTVMFVGNLGGALIGGAVLGWILTTAGVSSRQQVDSGTEGTQMNPGRVDNHNELH